MNFKGASTKLTLITMISLILYLVIDINLISKCELSKEHLKKKQFWIPTTLAMLAGLYLIFGQSAANSLRARAATVQPQAY